MVHVSKNCYSNDFKVVALLLIFICALYFPFSSATSIFALCLQKWQFFSGHYCFVFFFVLAVFLQPSPQKFILSHFYGFSFFCLFLQKHFILLHLFFFIIFFPVYDERCMLFVIIISILPEKHVYELLYREAKKKRDE